MLTFFQTALVLVIYLVVLPLLAGALTGQLRQKNILSFIGCWVRGWLLLMTSFQICTVPLILLHSSLTAAICLWNAMLAAGAVFLLWYRCRNRKSLTAGTCLQENRLAAHERILLFLFVIIVGVQCAAYIAGMHIDEDDARYVANAVAAVETNTMYRIHPNTGEVMNYFMGEISKEVTSPLMMFYAAYAKLAGIHPAILIHTIMPCVWLLLDYSILALTGVELFEDWRGARILFLLICALVQTWGYTSIYTASTFILTRGWQGKSMIASVFAPLGFLLFLQRWNGKKEGWYRKLLLFELSACLCSGMGIYLSAILTAVIAFPLAFHEKKAGTLVKCACCCLPNGVYVLLYLLVKEVILR